MTEPALIANPDCDHGVMRRCIWPGIEGPTWVCANDHHPDCYYIMTDRDKFALTRGGHDVIAERERQVKDKGFTKRHDRKHRPSEFTRAAQAYIEDSRGSTSTARYTWPWRPHEFKTDTPRAELVKAGALIIAAIDRIDDMQQMIEEDGDDNPSLRNPGE